MIFRGYRIDRIDAVKATVTPSGAIALAIHEGGSCLYLEHFPGGWFDALAFAAPWFAYFPRAPFHVYGLTIGGAK